MDDSAVLIPHPAPHRAIGRTGHDACHRAVRTQGLHTCIDRHVRPMPCRDYRRGKKQGRCERPARISWRFAGAILRVHQRVRPCLNLGEYASNKIARVGSCASARHDLGGEAGRLEFVDDGREDREGYLIGGEAFVRIVDVLKMS